MKEIEKDTKVKKTRTVKEIKEPEFASLKEELAWLKKKKKKEPIDEMRIAFLEQPIKVIGPTKKEMEAAKKVAKKKAPAKRKTTKKPVVKLDNGEFIPTPTTFAKLKTYVNKYFKAVGWKTKNYTFPNTEKLSITDFKVTGDEKTQSVTVTGKLIWQNSRQMFTHPFKKVYTLENHKEVRTTIINTYKMVEKHFKDKKEVPSQFFRDHEWGMVYDM